MSLHLHCNMVKPFIHKQTLNQLNKAENKYIYTQPLFFFTSIRVRTNSSM